MIVFASFLFIVFYLFVSISVVETRKKRGTECSTSLTWGSGKPVKKDIDTISPRYTA